MAGLYPGLYANGFNLNSNGAKAIAMGGAFVGLADDYSAVFWNPAGITQMKETSLSLFVTDIIPKCSYQLTLPGLNIDTQAVSKQYLSGSFGFFKPLSEKVVIGLYAYVPSGIGSEWEGSDLKWLSNGTAYEWKSYVGIITVSPVVAFKLSEIFSLGATINLNYGFAQLSRPGLGQYSEDTNGIAIGATLGLLLKPSDKFRFGLTFKTPLKVKLEGDATMSGAPLLHLPDTSDAKREANFPMWLAAGIAFKPLDNLTITADAQYTNWKTMDTISMEFSEPTWKAAFEKGSQLKLDWKDCVQLRFGMEYKFSQNLALRGGYYIDPNPGPKNTLTILLPQHAFNFICCGLGLCFDNLTIDLGFEYGMGKDVVVAPADLKAGDPGMVGTHALDVIVPNIAVTFRF
jgi:long-chain fatty acid transport protein